MKREGISALPFRKWLRQLLDEVGDSSLSRTPNPNRAFDRKRKQGKEAYEVQGVLPTKASGNGAMILCTHVISPLK
jgi:hypothetical protein